MVRLTRPLMAMFIIMALFSPGCAKMPPDLTPPAQIAWRGTQGVVALDVLRDGVLSLYTGPAAELSLSDVRTLVLWHQASVEVIHASPGGWVAVVKASAWKLTCEPMAAPSPPPQTCRPALPASTVARIAPFLRVALVVINEIDRTTTRVLDSAEVIAAFNRTCERSLQVDALWLAAHPVR